MCYGRLLKKIQGGWLLPYKVESYMFPIQQWLRARTATNFIHLFWRLWKVNCNQVAQKSKESWHPQKERRCEYVLVWGENHWTPVKIAHFEYLKIWCGPAQMDNVGLHNQGLQRLEVCESSYRGIPPNTHKVRKNPRISILVENLGNGVDNTSSSGEIRN